MFGTIVGIAAAEVVAAKARHDAFMESIADLPEAERQRQIERREDHMVQMAAARAACARHERAHDPSTAFFGGVILGAILG